MFWMLIWETVICDMLIRALTPRFPSGRRHGRRAILGVFVLQCAGWLVAGLGDKVFAPY
jgi:hypothetical protein